MTHDFHWTVPTDHPAFAGHFPGTPIVPGVLLLDQALLTLAGATGLALDALTIRSVKFLSPAGPGDEIAVEHRIAANGAIHFEIFVGTPTERRRLASGSVVAGLAESAE